MPIPRLAVKGVAALSGGASAASTVRRASRGGGSCVGNMNVKRLREEVRVEGALFRRENHLRDRTGKSLPLHPHDARETRCSGA